MELSIFTFHIRTAIINQIYAQQGSFQVLATDSTSRLWEVQQCLFTAHIPSEASVGPINLCSCDTHVCLCCGVNSLERLWDTLHRYIYLCQPMGCPNLALNPVYNGLRFIRFGTSSNVGMSGSVSLSLSAASASSHRSLRKADTL